MDEKSKCAPDLKLCQYTDPNQKGEESTGHTFYEIAKYHKGDNMGVTMQVKNKRMIVVNADSNLGMNNNKIDGAGHVIEIEGKVIEEKTTFRKQEIITKI